MTHKMLVIAGAECLIIAVIYFIRFIYIFLIVAKQSIHVHPFAINLRCLE